MNERTCAHLWHREQDQKVPKEEHDREGGGVRDEQTRKNESSVPDPFHFARASAPYLFAFARLYVFSLRLYVTHFFSLHFPFESNEMGNKIKSRLLLLLPWRWWR